MKKRPSCVLCGREAIGSQSFGCRSSCVCQDHAYHILLLLEPGETYTNGECRFERYGPEYAEQRPEPGCS